MIVVLVVAGPQLAVSDDELWALAGVIVTTITAMTTTSKPPLAVALDLDDLDLGKAPVGSRYVIVRSPFGLVDESGRKVRQGQVLDTGHWRVTNRRQLEQTRSVPVADDLAAVALESFRCSEPLCDRVWASKEYLAMCDASRAA